MQWVTAGLAGLLLGLGLILSGMANPAKVIGFLDVAGPWDPSLGLVMGGGLVVGSIGFALLKKQPKTLSGEPLNLPASRKIDLRLILGSVLFGIGWGITGICPGPGLVLLGAGIPEGVIYVASLLAGMTLYSLIEKLRHSA
ncbi:MAG: DUF6691 family protein [Fluviibacter sp.]|jgi:uncharacterized membrane protein YedE/YeeE|nr:YeeE/YedE family protein [Rhodocyclales bacterium]